MMQAHTPYRDEPHLQAQQSQADIQQYYDSPNSGGIPMQQRQGSDLDYGGGYSTQNNRGENMPLDSGSRAVPPNNNNWLENSATREGGRSKRWIMIVAVGVLFALIGAGVAVGVVVAKKHASNDSKSNSSSSSSSSSSGSSSNSSGDPSQFTKNPALIQSFYGIAYTPEGSQLPECGNSLADIITDIQLLSQLTTRIRLYGADCNQTELVLEAIKQTKVDMIVWIGNYPIATDNNTAYDRQRDELTAAIQKYGVANIGGYTVGNEFILDYLDDNNATDPNGSVGDAGAALLLADINDTKSTLAGLGLSNMSIGNAEAGAYFNTEILGAVNYGMANVHAWFAGTTIDAAAPWVFEYFQDTDVAAATALSNNPTMYIAETGWPTNSSTTADMTNGASPASVANLQIFLDNFVCQANANGTKYFFFEYFDEAWKNIQFGGVEGYWGLFTANRTLKDGLTIPKC